MALWQYCIDLYPKIEVEKYFGNDINYIPEKYYEKDWWLLENIPLGLCENISLILPKGESYSKDIKLWGNYESNVIEVISDEKEFYGISARIDLLNSDKLFIENLNNFVQSYNFIMLDKLLRVIYPNSDDLFESIEKSKSYSFVSNPSSYFKDIANKPNKMD